MTSPRLHGGKIAALVGHAKASVTNKYIHSLDTARIMAADTITGYVQGLLADFTDREHRFRAIVSTEFRRS
ncbi:hypothetical protein ABIF69_000961 [Bradyrhizobium japonicum]